MATNQLIIFVTHHSQSLGVVDDATEGEVVDILPGVMAEELVDETDRTSLMEMGVRSAGTEMRYEKLHLDANGQ